jgi:DNA polymerase-1
VDGSGFLFRAYHALPPMTRGDGTPVNAVYGFTTMLFKLIEETDADHVAVIFDAARKTFRNEIYPQYKAQRPEPPEDLLPQFPLVRDATRAMNIACIEHDGYEADDVIATYACKAVEAGAKVTIVSSDKDLMQLIGDGIVLFDAMRNRTIGAAEVREKFGVGPERIVDLLALAGDSIDNVPGVPGIGVKTAAQLLEEYGDLEGLLARAAEIKQPKRRESLIEHAEAARVSRRLVDLCRTVPVPLPLSAMAVKKPDPDSLLGFLRAQGFKSLIPRVERGLAAGAATPAAAPVAAAGQPAKRDYALVTAPRVLDGWIAEARENGQVAIDVATETGLCGMRPRLVGIALAVTPGRACYIPLRHVGTASQGALDLGDGAIGEGAPEQIPLDQAMPCLKSLLEDDSVLKIGHDIKGDMQVLAREGIAVAPVDDTMVLSYVLDSALHGHGLEELAKLHFEFDTVSYADVAGSGRNQIPFDRVPLGAAMEFAAEAADVSLRLHARLKPRLREERVTTVYETIERPLIPVLERVERNGIKVDAAALRALSADFSRRLLALEDEIYRLAGHEFNIGSPKQLGEVLFDEMGLGGARKGKTGAYGTGADVLERLAAEGHELPVKVLDWRQLSKLKSTYADALVEQINPQTGRVHTCFAMAVASTGRLSSIDPNLQNIPVRTEEGRKIRRAFVAAEGYRLLSADYSQIELRLLAHVAGIEALKEAFRRNLDIHAMTASQVFETPIEGMDPMVRRKAKAINFGIIYGISAFGLARQIGVPQGEAKRYIEAYFARYPGILDYMEQVKSLARKQGFVTTLYGRRIHVRGINDRNPNLRGFAERAAINAPIQGGAADIIKRAMVRLPPALEKAGLNARMLLQVHDELVFEVPDAEAESTTALVKDVMEKASALDVPLVVETGLGHAWDEAH